MEMQELIKFDSEGFIPGPNETEVNFLERVRAAKESFNREKMAIPAHHWHWAAEQLQMLFDFAPRWCTAIYSSQGLAPWQAAATWINVKRLYIIQLKPSRWVSWLIDRDEVLAHEAAHAARAAFDEPKFEEMFAYLTASRKWRQVAGPLFRKPVEALILCGLLGAGSLLQIAEAFWDGLFLSSIFFWAAAICCLGWSFRLLKMRVRLARAAKKIIPLLRDPSQVRAALFRLTDAEIEQLARGEMTGGSDLRWQLLRAKYFNISF